MVIVGMILTSFMQALSYRLIHHMNWWSDRSRCEHCQHVLSWYELIPVLSFIMLKGKCRHCGKKISYIYPVMELAGGIICHIIYQYFGYGMKTWIIIVVFFLLFGMSMIDYYTYYVYIPFLILFGLLSFIYRMETIGVQDLVFDILIFTLPLWLLARYTKGMGEGDVEFVLCASLLLGSMKMLLALFVACIAALIYVFIGKIKRKNIRKIPFIPFLSLGTLLMLFYGSEILRCYLMFIYIS